MYFNPGGTCLRKWQGCMDQRIRKTKTHPYFFAVLDPYLWIFDEHFSTIITIFDDFWYLHVSHSFSQWWLLIVLTILNNSVTIFDDFSIKSFVQVEEYTHFYRFSCTVGTYTSAPHSGPTKAKNGNFSLDTCSWSDQNLKFVSNSAHNRGTWGQIPIFMKCYSMVWR